LRLGASAGIGFFSTSAISAFISASLSPASAECHQQGLRDGEFLSQSEEEESPQEGVSNREKAKVDLFDYVDRFYNPYRRHSTFGHTSPADYEQAPELR
jgi:transposase InsO family protein